jgi:hypothetical protein
MHAEVVDVLDEPYVLARGTTDDDEAKRAAAEAWLAHYICSDDPDLGYRLPDAWRVTEPRWWRWVPDANGANAGTYSRWLHPAEPHARGAFLAVEVWPS